jgi:hypothetical protein
MARNSEHNSNRSISYGIMDAFEAMGIVTAQEIAEPRELLERTVSMLTKMARAELNPRPRPRPRPRLRR